MEEREEAFPQSNFSGGVSGDRQRVDRALHKITECGVNHTVPSQSRLPGKLRGNNG